MHVAFFGSSLVSAYWNGAATYYRGLLRALADRGHRVTFYEPDAYDRQAHRDLPDPEWAEVVVYPGGDESALRRCLAAAGRADLVVKASGVGVFDALLEAAALDLQSSSTRVVFWDVDAPATLDRLSADRSDAFRALIPRYDAVLTYGGGGPVSDAYRTLGARLCVPIYNALDPETHHPVEPEARFACDLAFLGNRLPDREARVESFFFEPARRLPALRFIIGGSGWHDAEMPPNVQRLGHVYTRDHNALNRSARAVLNISRESMARYGFSPARSRSSGWSSRPGSSGCCIARRSSHRNRPKGGWLEYKPRKTEPSKARWLDAGRARSLDHLVVGQRPRGHLARAGLGARAGGSRRALSGARRAVVRRPSRPAGAAVRTHRALR